MLSIQTAKHKNEKFLQLLQGTHIVKTSGWIKFQSANTFNWTKRAKRKDIEVVDLLEKPDIPKVSAVKTRKRGGCGNKVKEYSKSENSV